MLKVYKTIRKQKEIFLYCKHMKFDIIMMQEVHSELNNEPIFQSEWGGKIIFSHGTTQARGTAILFNPKCM